MKRNYRFTVIVVAAIFMAVGLHAQVSEIVQSDRYIVIDDLNSFFAIDDIDKSIVNCSFELYNIYENESSKPVFVDVTDLSGVVKFSIKSASERFENQRSCFLKMSAQNYMSTFRLVLDRMKVKYVKYRGINVPVSVFISENL